MEGCKRTVLLHLQLGGGACHELGSGDAGMCSVCVSVCVCMCMCMCVCALV